MLWRFSQQCTKEARSDKCCGNWSHRTEAPIEGTREQLGPLGSFRLKEFVGGAGGEAMHSETKQVYDRPWARKNSRVLAERSARVRVGIPAIWTAQGPFSSNGPWLTPWSDCPSQTFRFRFSRSPGARDSALHMAEPFSGLWQSYREEPHANPQHLSAVTNSPVYVNFALSVSCVVPAT